MQLDPDNAAYRLLAAQNLRSLGKPNEAAEHIQHILKTQSDPIEANLFEADGLLAAGQTANAIERYRAVLARDPAQSTAANNLAWLLAVAAGTAPGKDSEAAEAIALAEGICKAAGNQIAEPLDTLALAYAAAGRFDDAVVRLSGGLGWLAAQEYAACR